MEQDIQTTAINHGHVRRGKQVCLYLFIYTNTQGRAYTYSGLTMRPVPFDDNMTELKQELQTQLGLVSPTLPNPTSSELFVESNKTENKIKEEQKTTLPKQEEEEEVPNVALVNLYR